jgi:hypothetical protein
MPRRLIELVEHYPYDSVTDAPNDSLLPRPRFSTRQYDALFVQMHTEYSGALKPKSHPLRLIADALCAQSTPESATADDAGLWDSIKKASLALDTQECTKPTPIFSNIFCDETIHLLSLIPLDASDKDKSASSFVLQSPISPSGSRPFSLLESPLKPIQTAHVRASSSSGQALGVPGLTANLNTAPTTASPETPTDWLQFSNQGFGTMPSTRDLVAKLWDDDVEVTVPPMSLSRKSSRRARSRGSSIDSPSTQTLPPVAPAPLITKTTLISKVKLDEAFIDVWADSLLDPISNLWPRFVLCQLKPLPPTVASTIPTPTWLIIEQRFVHIPPAPLPKEEAEVTAPTSRPRASSPRPESSRLSAAFSLASKKRFGFFTANSSDPKSPKEKVAPLPQVGEFGESVKGTGDVAAEVQKSKEEARTQGGMNKGLASIATAVGTTAIAVATARAAQEEIVPAPAKDGLPVVIETVPSEPPTVNIDVAEKDSRTPANMGQNGLASREDEQRKPEPAIQDSTDADGATIPPATSESVTTEAKPPVKEVEADTEQPELASASAADRLRLADDTNGGLIPQTEAAPTELEPTLAISAPEVPPLGSAPVPEEPSIPEPIIEDAHTSQDSEPTHVLVEDAPVEIVPALVVEELVVPAPEETNASQMPVTASVSSTPDLPVEAEAAAQEPFTETVAPGIEEAQSLKELPTSTSTPIDASAAAEPIPVSEKSEAPQPEDNVAATLASPAAVVVEDSPVTESVSAGDDGTAPVYKGEAAASAGAAEASALPEESSPPTVGLIIEDDSQPASLPETHAIPEEPANVEATIHESGTDPVPVNQPDASCSPAIPATPETADVEPTVEPIGFTPPLDETNPSWQAQDDVIEERPTTEEVGPVVKEPFSVADADAAADLAEASPDVAEPHQASADESTPAEVPATSHGDEDTVLVELTAAERTTLDIRCLIFF